MAPKRKRTTDPSADAAPKAGTRSSTRLKASSNAADGSISTVSSESRSAAGEACQVEPATKRAKKGSTKTAAAAKGGRGKAGQAQASPNQPAVAVSSSPHVEKVAKPAPSKPAVLEPYSPERAGALFKTYEDPDTPGSIGPEGFEKLCSDMDVSLEGALPLLLAWQLNAAEMAKISESEWIKATGDLRISNLQTLSLSLRDLEDLLLLNKPPISAKKASSTPSLTEPYNRQRYFGYAANKDKAFSALYAFCFALAKPPSTRNIDMETASAFWSVLVAPRYPLMADLLVFINEKGVYKGVNKDLWSMTLEFCRTVKPDFSNYEADGAWPTMLDDFVAWKKPGVTNGGPSADTDS